MLFIVAGLPAPFFERFEQLIQIVFGKGNLVIRKPLRLSTGGRYELNANHADQLIEELSKRITNDPAITTEGCGLIVLAQDMRHARHFTERFYPFVLGCHVPLPTPLVTLGTPGRITLNRVASAVANAIPSLRAAVTAVNTELSCRWSRTPLQLPLRNFSSKVLNPEIERLFWSLVQSQAPEPDIHRACQAIEREHPFSTEEGRSFWDRRSKRFKMPGRALHGDAKAVGADHRPECLIAGRLRLGGSVRDGFHFDCFQGAKGVLKGRFPDCHGASATWTGKPHLNIAPSDFIRR